MTPSLFGMMQPPAMGTCGDDVRGVTSIAQAHCSHQFAVLTAMLWLALDCAGQLYYCPG